jgi:hypothetical protein
MKKINLSITLFTALLTSSIAVFAGNPDRAGEAGGSQLLINPWTKSVGWAGANTASVTGLEAMSLNIAGMAFTKQTEVLVNHKRWLVGSDININSFGLSQRVGETGVFGFSVMSMNFGDIDITTEDNPEGGIGTFSPSYLNLDFGYAKTFSNSISGGLSVKIISESIANVSSRGFAFDAGVRYVTGENDQIKFGIALKNVGPTMQAAGDGLSFSNTTDITGVELVTTQNRRASRYQLPSLLNIGGSYDFYIAPQEDSATSEIKADHRITVAANFTSNSFTKDQYKIGVEYGFKSMFMLRLGYVLEQTTWFDSAKRTSAYTGPSMGASLVAPLGKKGSTFGVHYAYQLTEKFSGTHSIGIRFDL